MNPRAAFIMDPIESIKPYKDTTLAMMLEAQRRGLQVWYLPPESLHMADGVPACRATRVTVFDDNTRWFVAEVTEVINLHEFDWVFMRKDPPFDMAYVYATQLLERAEQLGARVVNRPGSLRDCNEKLFIGHFPQCCAPTLVTSDRDDLRAFLQQHGKMVVKPLDGMGGASIFVVTDGDVNTGVILESMTAHRTLVMAQRFLPEIADGDKRILMVHGEPVDYALARIPASGESRGNLAAGGRGVGQPLSERDRWIAAQVGPELRKRGLWFVGLDVIGAYLTEINVTSPTCARELDAEFGLNIAGQLFDALADHYPR